MRLIFLTNHWPHPPGETFLTSDIEALSNYVDEIIVIPLGLNFDQSSTPHPTPSNVNTDLKPVTLAAKKWKKWGKFRRAIKGFSRIDIIRSERLRKPSLPLSIIIGEVAQSLLLRDTISRNCLLVI